MNVSLTKPDVQFADAEERSKELILNPTGKIANAREGLLRVEIVPIFSTWVRSMNLTDDEYLAEYWARVVPRGQPRLASSVLKWVYDGSFTIRVGRTNCPDVGVQSNVFDSDGRSMFRLRKIGPAGELSKTSTIWIF